jgi:hypothetical protein
MSGFVGEIYLSPPSFGTIQSNSWVDIIYVWQHVHLYLHSKSCDGVLYCETLLGWWSKYGSKGQTHLLAVETKYPIQYSECRSWVGKQNHQLLDQIFIHWALLAQAIIQGGFQDIEAGGGCLIKTLILPKTLTHLQLVTPWNIIQRMYNLTRPHQYWEDNHLMDLCDVMCLTSGETVAKGHSRTFCSHSSGR